MTTCVGVSQGREKMNRRSRAENFLMNRHIPMALSLDGHDDDVAVICNVRHQMQMTLVRETALCRRIPSQNVVILVSKEKEMS